MTNLRLLAIALITFSVSACTITGPADDGFENSLESVDIGKIQDNESTVLKQLTELIGDEYQ